MNNMGITTTTTPRVDVGTIKIVKELPHKQKEEIILCAAIWVNDNQIYIDQPINLTNGFVISGHRHCCIFEIISKFHIDKKLCKQGFLTSNNRFLDREEAMRLARKMGQVYKETMKDDTLFSEDLY